MLSFIGASSIIVPIPYQVALLAMSFTGEFNLFLLAAAAGLGSAFGEVVGYGIGYSGRRFVNRKQDRRFNAVVRIFDRFGAPVIFIFALTPLPDDLLFIPLGLMRYTLWKALIACVAGKFFMSLIVIYTGSVAGEMFVESWVFALATAVVLILVIIAIFRIDWEKLLIKYA